MRAGDVRRTATSVRVRGDSIFQDLTGFQNRNRGRIRVRFGLDGKLSEDFVGGLSLATGSLGDPTSTNETLTNFFDRKTIGLDRGYITYNPVAHKWLSITAGKFAYTCLKWNRKDSILQPGAFATQATTTGSTTVAALPVTGEGPGCAAVLGGPKFAPCPFGPNGMTNATFVDSKGNAHFFSGYNYADFILNNQIKTPAARLPLNVLLEFEDNLDAEPHPLDAKGNLATGLGSQNKAYLAEVSLGQLKNKNDFQFGYAYQRQEQDSVIASFDESDQRPRPIFCSIVSMPCTRFAATP